VAPPIAKIRELWGNGPYLVRISLLYGRQTRLSEIGPVGDVFLGDRPSMEVNPTFQGVNKYSKYRAKRRPWRFVQFSRGPSSWRNSEHEQILGGLDAAAKRSILP
jgi:hypothetical protein